MSDPTTWLYQDLPDGPEGKVGTNGRAGSDVPDARTLSRTDRDIFPESRPKEALTRKSVAAP